MIKCASRTSSNIAPCMLQEMVDKIGDGFCWGVGEEDVMSSVVSARALDGPLHSKSEAAAM